MATIKKTPAIRFKGCEEEWDWYFLDDLVDFYSGLTYSPKNVRENSGTLVLRSSNVKNGEIIDADNVYVDTEVVNSTNVRVGDIIIVVRNGSRSLIGKHAQIKREMTNTVIGAFMTGIHYEYSSFMNCLLDSPKFYKEIEKNLGATINQITTGAFKKMHFAFPKPTEQTLIGNYFKKFDGLIRLQEQKLKKVTTLKKAMLEKMFPKKNADVPEIRYKGFTENWEKKNLGEVADKIGDGLHGTPLYNENGTVFFINGNNLVNGEIIVNNETKCVTEIEQSINDKLLNPKTILLSINGTIGNLAFYNNEKIMLGKSVAYIILNGVNKNFIYAYLQSPVIIKFFNDNLTGSTIKNLGLKTIRNTKMLIPTKEEQQKIGEYFQSLDQLMNQSQQKIEQLKHLKQALLQKMFI